MNDVDYQKNISECRGQAALAQIPVVRDSWKAHGAVLASARSYGCAIVECPLPAQFRSAGTVGGSEGL